MEVRNLTVVYTGQQPEQEGLTSCMSKLALSYILCLGFDVYLLGHFVCGFLYKLVWDMYMQSEQVTQKHVYQWAYR